MMAEPSLPVPLLVALVLVAVEVRLSLVVKVLPESWRPASGYPSLFPPGAGVGAG